MNRCTVRYYSVTNIDKSAKIYVQEIDVDKILCTLKK